MDADVRGAVDADHAARVLPHPPADECEQAVATRETLELGARLGRDGRILRARDDRRERAVHIEDDGGPLGLGGETCDRIHAS